MVLDKFNLRSFKIPDFWNLSKNYNIMYNGRKYQIMFTGVSGVGKQPLPRK